MRKSSVFVLLIVIIAVLMPGFPSASSNYSTIIKHALGIDAMYGAIELKADSICKIGDRSYIPVKPLLSELGSLVQWDSSKSEVVAVWNGFTLRSKPNCRIFTVNGRVFSSDSRIISKSGTTYIPLDFLKKTLGLKVTENSDTGIVKISGIPDFSGFGTLDDIFPASPVNGTITRKANLYTSAGGKIKGTIAAKTPVEVLADKNYNWYNIRTTKGVTGWLGRNDISIDEAYGVNSDTPSKEEIETYVELKKLDSSTGYIAWVDISRQLVYILSRQANGFKLYKMMKCSTGSNKSPTTRGAFTVKKDRGNWFYSSAAGSGAKFWVRFNGLYLFHSIALDSRQNIQDPTLGKRVSSGCVRLSLEDSFWVYQNLKEGTAVLVN